MSNHNDEDVSVVGSFERETRLLHQMLEQDAQDGFVAPAGDAFVNPLQGREVQFELPPDHPLRAAAAPSARIGGTVTTVDSVAVFGRANRRTLDEIAIDEILVRKNKRGAHGTKI